MRLATLFQHRNRHYFALIFLTAALLYSNTIFHEFTVDDYNHVEQNELIKSREGVSKLFFEPTEPGNLYRPVMMLSLALDYFISRESAFSFHLSNIFYHSLASALVFLFLFYFFRSSLGQLEEVARGKAFFSAFLFAVHPIHTEAVANISNRNEILVAIFLLLYFILLYNYSGRLIRFIPGAIILLLAFLSKESAFVVLLLIPLVTYFSYLFNDKPIWKLKEPLLHSAVAGSVYFVMRSNALSGVQLVNFPISPVDNPLVELSLVERFFPALNLLGKYISLNFFPLVLSADYSFAKLTASLEFSDPLVIVNFILVTFLIFFSLQGLIKGKAYAFFSLRFFFSFAVTANIIIPTGTIFAERLSYLPSIGICGLLGSLVFLTPNKLFSVLLFAFISIFYSSQTYTRNYFWRDNLTLAREEVLNSGESVRANIWYAFSLREARQKGEVSREEANLKFIEALLKKSLKLAPEIAEAHLELARIYFMQGRREEAATVLGQGLSHKPRHVPSLVLLAHHKRELGELEKAAELYLRALDNSKKRPLEVLLGLLVISLERGDEAKAAELRSEIERRDPGNTDLASVLKSYGHEQKKK